MHIIYFFILSGFPKANFGILTSGQTDQPDVSNTTLLLFHAIGHMLSCHEGPKGPMV